MTLHRNPSKHVQAFLLTPLRWLVTKAARPFRVRPGSSMMFIMSMALLMAVPTFAYRFYAVSGPIRSFVEIDPARELIPRVARVEAEYVPGKLDLLRIFVSFDADPWGAPLSPNEADLVLTVPRRLRSTTQGTFRNCIEQMNDVEYENVRWLYYRFKRTPECHGITLTQQFEGNLFHASQQHIWLDLWADVKPSKAPTEVMVVGLTGVALESAFPEPNERSPHVFLYRWAGTPERDGNRGRVIIRGMDEVQASRSSLILFGIGIMCGVLASIIASFVVEAIRTWENPTRSA